MKTIEIFWDDLTEAKKAEILEAFGDNQNWDVCPIAVVEVEEEEEDTCECPLGGDESDDCADCAYGGDYHFVNGECVEREEGNEDTFVPPCSKPHAPTDNLCTGCNLHDKDNCPGA